MKEKENFFTCPRCGGKHPINNENYLFYEQWKRALENRLCADAGMPFSSISVPGGCYWTLVDRVLMPLPPATKKWIEETPEPKINSQGFLIKLAQRVEALEAALAEKGGVR